MNNFTRVPDYIAYLAHILTTTQEEARIRTIAGYLLKNNSRLILNATPEVVAYVKVAVLQAFTDSTVMIRNAAGQDIVAFLGVLEPRNWPECLQQLVNSLDSEDVEHQEVSTSPLFMLCLPVPRVGTANVSCYAASARAESAHATLVLIIRPFYLPNALA